MTRLSRLGRRLRAPGDCAFGFKMHEVGEVDGCNDDGGLWFRKHYKSGCKGKSRWPRGQGRRGRKGRRRAQGRQSPKEANLALDPRAKGVKQSGGSGWRDRHSSREEDQAIQPKIMHPWLDPGYPGGLKV
jgi:hypothetical protein